MGSPYTDWKLLQLTGTGNTSGTLDATEDNTFELTEGAWEIWADQDYYVQINAASGASMGANPVAKPARHVTYVAVPKSMYLGIKRIDTDGTYYVNKVSGPI